MNRITKGQLSRLLTLAAKKLRIPKGYEILLDHYQPGGNPYVWTLILRRKDLTGGEHRPFFEERMSTHEMRAYLMGLNWALYDKDRLKR